MLDLLLGIAGRALGSLAGPGARHISQRIEQRRLQGAPGYSALSDTDVVKHSIALGLAAADISEADSSAVTAFLDSPEADLLARYLALDVLTDRAAKVGPELLAQAEALLMLASSTKATDAKKIAPIVTQAIAYSIATLYAQIKRVSKTEADFMRQIAIAERQARTLGNLSQASRELWNLGGFDPSGLSDELKVYCTRVEEEFATLGIPSLDEERRVPLSEGYVEPDVGVNIAHYRRNEAEDGTALMSALRSHSRILVMGDPGGGKSTLARASVHQLAREASAGRYTAIPFFISLAQYVTALKRPTPPPSLISYSASELRRLSLANLGDTEIRYVLATGRAVVFLDGLDEILDVHERQAVRDEIESLSRAYKGSAFVVMSRSIGYEEAPLDTNEFRRVEIQALTMDKVRDFARKFFSHSNGVGPGMEAEEAWTDFLEQTTSLPDLTSNPLMLGLLCLLYDTGKTVPRNQAEMFSDCARLLFSRWDSKRGISIQLADAATAEDAVATVALAIFSSGEEEVYESWLRQELVSFYTRERSAKLHQAERFASDVIDLWRGRKWLMVSVGRRGGEHRFKFAHRTFLEYFAAQQLAFENAPPERLWSQLQPLILARAATVYCLLAAQIQSRSLRGSGDYILQQLSGIVRQKSANGWKAAAFAGELLPSVRAERSAKEDTCRAISDCILSMVPITKELPSVDDWSIDVLSGEYFDTSDVVFDGEEESAKLFLTFSQATVPLYHMTRAGEESFDSLLAVVADEALSRIRGDGGLPELQVVKFCLEATQYPSMEEWGNLSKSEQEGYSRWAERLKSDLLNVLEERGWPRGEDVWCDVYRVRETGSLTAGMAGRLGISGLLLGGWSLPTIPGATEPTGTALRRIFFELLSNLDQTSKRGVVVDWSALTSEFSKTTLAELRAKDAGMFQAAGAFSEEAQDLLERVALAAASESQKAVYVCCLATLAAFGEQALLSALEASSDELTRACSKLAATVLFPGEALEFGEELLRKSFGDQESLMLTATYLGLRFDTFD